jgi:hypothetical protein
MSEPIAVLALRRKRDLISGTIAKYEKLILAAQHDLAHVNSALRLFEVTGEAADLPPYVDLNRVLRRGETTAICMAALEKEGPLDTRQLAMRVIRAKGFSETDKVLAQTIALRVVQTLRMRARRGKVESVTRTKGVCIWRIPKGPWMATELPLVLPQ